MKCEQQFRKKCIENFIIIGILLDTLRTRSDEYREPQTCHPVRVALETPYY